MPSAEPAEGRVLQPFGPPGSFFESPRWHDGRWWVSDMFGQRVLALDAAGEVVTELAFDDHPSGLGWLPDGRMLVVLMRSRVVLAVDAAGRSSLHCDLSGLGRGDANDLVTDRTGRAWVGFLGFDMAGGEPPATTDLVRVEPDGSACVAASGLMTPNGAALVDGSLLIAETLASRISAFGVTAAGELTERRVLVQLAPEPPYADLRTCLRGLRSAPDGVAADAAGRLWVADAAGRGCLLVDAGGQVIAEVPAPPGLQTFACAVGEAALLVCCAPDAVESRRTGRSDGSLQRLELSALLS